MTTLTVEERTQESLERRVRESAPLIDRLHQCMDRIGKMCAEHRGPRMTIPVEWSDDDFFICCTLEDAARELAAAQPSAGTSKEGEWYAYYDDHRHEMRIQREPIIDSESGQYIIVRRVDAQPSASDADYVLVPREPTKEFFQPAYKQLGYPGGNGTFLQRAWPLLLAAAPSPQQAGESFAATRAQD